MSAKQWLKEFLPEAHILINGHTGGWTVKCIYYSPLEEKQFDLEFDEFPTPDELVLAALKMISKKKQRA